MGFPLETQESIGIGRERFWKDLQRDVPMQTRITCAIHLTHPARTQSSEDLVDAETEAGR